MPDSPRKQDLREISHLFLSGVRQKSIGDAPAPVRIGPRQRAEQAVELSAEELAEVSGPLQVTGALVSLELTCVIGGHLGGRLAPAARAYAVASAGDEPVGLIELEATALRVSLIEPGGASSAGAGPEPFDARRVEQVLTELSCDVRRWVVAMPNPRLPEARDLLVSARRMVLLCEQDADGTVAAYRALKGICDLLPREAQSLPRLWLCVLDAAESSARATYLKMASVCEQFLRWPLERGATLTTHDTLGAMTVLDCRCGAETPPWGVVTDALLKSPVEPPALNSEAAVDVQIDATEQAGLIGAARPLPAPETATIPAAAPTPPPVTVMATRDDDDDVIELPGGATDEPASILAAVLNGCGGRWMGSPVAPPMCPTARVAVDRHRTLCLLAVVGSNLESLRLIAEAYEWINQNRSLIAMALPQLAIDAHAMPRLTLLVDRHTAAADELRPVLSGGRVGVLTYRKLRWSGRAGLLLEAA